MAKHNRRRERRLGRKPPIAVLRELRSEVGYGCPIQGCGAPYLEWHHFDPLWHVENHHRPEGMIALCPTHHSLANAYTVEQLRFLKAQHRQAERIVHPVARFEWLRNDLLVFAGGTVFHATPVVFRCSGRDVISISRNEDGMMTLNVRMLTLSGKRRIQIEDNYWTVPPREEGVDFECPPNGRSIKAAYKNGDFLEVKFADYVTPDDLSKKLERDLASLPLVFPVTLAEVAYKIGGTGISFTAENTQIGGAIMQGGVVSRCAAGIVYEGPLPIARPNIPKRKRRKR